MSTTNESPKKTLRRLAEARRGVLVPGAFNALSATRDRRPRLRGDLHHRRGRHQHVLSASPDQAFMGLHEIADHTARIRDAVNLPLLVDADTGFGNALNVRHTVRVLERAGADASSSKTRSAPSAAATSPERQVIDTDEMLGKIKAAVDARQDTDLLVMARTDAAAVHGFEAAIERKQKFSDAGADILFVEAVTLADEVRAMPQRLNKPQLMNMVIGGKTPTFGAQELGARWATASCSTPTPHLQGAVAGMQKALTALRDDKRLEEDPRAGSPFRRAASASPATPRPGRARASLRSRSLQQCHAEQCQPADPDRRRCWSWTTSPASGFLPDPQRCSRRSCRKQLMRPAEARRWASCAWLSMRPTSSASPGTARMGARVKGGRPLHLDSLSTAVHPDLGVAPGDIMLSARRGVGAFDATDLTQLQHDGHRNPGARRRTH